MTTKRRIGPENSATRTDILDAVEAIMREDGYAAVSSRAVAARAGLTGGLIHYYFPTTDDLFIAAYRRAAAAVTERYEAALASDRPLRALWELNVDPERIRLAVEFMALGNHRKAIRTEIARMAGHTRDVQANALERILAESPAQTLPVSPEVLTVIVAGIARALVMEENMGLTRGHDATRTFVEEWLDRLDGPTGPA